MHALGRCPWFVALSLLVTLGVAAPRPALAGNIIPTYESFRYGDVFSSVQGALIGLGGAAMMIGSIDSFVLQMPRRFWSIACFVTGALNLASGVFFLVDNGSWVRSTFGALSVATAAGDFIVGGLITRRLGVLGRVALAPLVGRTPDGNVLAGASLRLLDF